MRGAEAPAVGGPKPALTAEAELPASGAQVRAACSAGRSYGGQSSAGQLSPDGLLLPLQRVLIFEKNCSGYHCKYHL